MAKTLLLALLFSLVLQAQEGTTQEHLLQLTPVPESIGVDPDISVQITFDSEIAETDLTPDKFLLRDDDDLSVSGKVSLGNDKKSITFRPDTALLKGEHHVELSTLTLKGNEQKPCPGFWNTINIQLCKRVSWRCDDICYEETVKRTEPIRYSFSVADTAAEIASLSIEVASRDLNESERVPVYVKAHYKDNTTKDITDKVSWESSDSSIVKVEAGYLIAQEEGSAQLSATFDQSISTTVTINVYKTVDNHRLPPEPDEALNNATLLGIDVNNNGVRDDVERWIYLEMEIQNGYPKIERAIGMQDAKAHQYILSDPENKDDKGVDAITASSDCWTWYEYIKGSEDIGAERRFSLAMEDKVYNTKKRLISYSKFNASLSGRIFGTVPTLQTKYQCTFDIDKL